MKSCFLILALLPLFISAQIKGRVTDAISGKPLPGSSIYINNSSIGTTSNGAGNFVLNAPPSQLYEVVVSYVGYQKIVSILKETENIVFVFKLEPVAQTMKELVIEVPVKDGWEKWGPTFLANFLGTSAIARKCIIRNIKTLKFYYNNKTQTLKVNADEPLEIVNGFLGYRIRYELEVFQMEEGYTKYAGYPFFTDLKKGEPKFEERRKEVYTGSLAHFFRSVYRGDHEDEGFVVRKMKRIENTNKKRVSELWRIHHIEHTALHRDSVAYYEKVLKESNFFDIVDVGVLPTDSFARKTDSGFLEVAFPDFLHVLFPKKKPPLEYYSFSRGLQGRREQALLSMITLKEQEGVVVTEQGLCYPPLNLVTQGFWGWWEKVGNMLPIDYLPAPFQ